MIAEVVCQSLGRDPGLSPIRALSRAGFEPATIEPRAFIAWSRACSTVTAPNAPMVSFLVVRSAGVRNLRKKTFRPPGVTLRPNPLVSHPRLRFRPSGASRGIGARPGRCGWSTEASVADLTFL